MRIRHLRLMGVIGIVSVVGIGVYATIPAAVFWAVNERARATAAILNTTLEGLSMPMALVLLGACTVMVTQRRPPKRLAPWSVSEARAAVREAALSPSERPAFAPTGRRRRETRSAPRPGTPAPTSAAPAPATPARPPASPAADKVVTPPAGLRFVQQLGPRTWEAEDQAGRRVGLRRLTQALTDDGLRRLSRDAERLARVQSPHVAKIHGLRPSREGDVFLVSELVRGVSVRQRLKSASRPMSPSEVARIGAQVAHGLAAIAELGIAHGAVSGRTVVLDASGTARLVESVLGQAPAPTPDVDVYALGVLLVEMLATRRTGRITGATAQPFKALLGRMMSECPEDRPSAASVARALERLELAAAVAA